MRTNEFTRINGPNVVLVPYKEKHVERYHQWMKSEELCHLTGSEPLTLEEEFVMQKRWHLDLDKCTFIVLEKNLYRTANDEIDAMIGDTNLFFNDCSCPHSAEAEIMIAEQAYRGKGRGSEAMILMLLYGIDKLNVTRYEVKIKLDNEKSIRLFQKFAFQEIGTSQVFQEMTLEKIVDQNWRDWLYSEIKGAVQYELYQE